MIIEFLLLSIVIGALRGGSIKDFYNTFFRRTWVITLGLVMYVGTFYFGLRGYSLVLNNIEKIYILSYIVILLGIIMNIRFREVFIVGIGAIMNLAVYLYNGGNVPILNKSLEILGIDNGINILGAKEGTFFIEMVEATKLSNLGHIISLPEPYPYPQIISFGDLIMAIGVLLLIQSVMRSTPKGGLNSVSFRR